MASTSSDYEPSTSSSTGQFRPSKNQKETESYDLTEWDSKAQSILYESMIDCKPTGINKHLNMLLIREKVSKELKKNITSASIWNFLKTKWDMGIADKIEGVCSDVTEGGFTLPEEYNCLIDNEEKLRELERYIDYTNKKSNNSTPNKNDGNNKTRVKTRRVTSDLLVVQQSLDVQPLGRRSCINKNS